MLEILWPHVLDTTLPGVSELRPAREVTELHDHIDTSQKRSCPRRCWTTWPWHGMAWHIQGNPKL